jgi:hypothetical protein
MVPRVTVYAIMAPTAADEMAQHVVLLTWVPNSTIAEDTPPGLVAYSGTVNVALYIERYELSYFKISAATDMISV